MASVRRAKYFKRIEESGTHTATINGGHQNFLFEGVSTLRKIILPKSVRYLDMSYFGNCTNLREIVLNADRMYVEPLPLPQEEIKDALTGMTEGYPFYGCSSLEKIILPNLNESVVSDNELTSYLSMLLTDWFKIEDVQTKYLIQKTTISLLKNAYLYVPDQYVDALNNMCVGTFNREPSETFVVTNTKESYVKGLSEL